MEVNRSIMLGTTITFDDEDDACCAYEDMLDDLKILGYEDIVIHLHAEVNSVAIGKLIQHDMEPLEIISFGDNLSEHLKAVLPKVKTVAAEYEKVIAVILIYTES